MREPERVPGHTASKFDPQAARARCEAAIPEPWRAELEYVSAFIPGKRPNGEIIGRWQPSISGLLSDEQMRANAEFAAHARTDLPAALEALEEAQKKLDAIRRAIDAASDSGQYSLALVEIGALLDLDRILKGE